MSKTIENLKSGNYEIVDNQGVSVTTHFIECLEKEFADLEAKLAESEKKYAELFCKNTELETLYSQKTALLNFYKDTDLVKENKELKQQLAEKERVCNWLDNVLKEYAKQEELLSKKLKSLGIDCIEDLGKTHNQDKISFCIERLEKVKEWLEPKYFDNEQIVYLTKIVDNQIKQLKEGK